ncbi:MAG: acetyl/propionyl/methylcrotonyl-CoA carboxylase subunit alpha [Alphaproteobacteria bacterium]
MFRTVLIANRGEIALRIQRACRLLGLSTVAAYSAADRDAQHVAAADRAICIGPAHPRASYLDPAALVLAARATGADAVHPGYGFLSENAGFARAVEAAGLVFIGPAPETIAVMGDKVAAKRAMEEAGVPCVPGGAELLGRDMAEAAARAGSIGYPVLVKAAAGGGGRGMRRVDDAAALEAAIALTRAEAAAAFGSEAVYLEKFLDRPRHIEIQVLCDGHGNAIHLGERDCSLQRRHQKVVEEAPAPHVPRALVAELGRRCVAACRRLGYRSLGTFEFLYQDEAFAFIEMNTRVQVEHPVTEMVTGIDLVRAQILVAMGEVLEHRQDDIRLTGHAVEARLNAEAPWTGAPAPGRIASFAMAGGPGIRIDTAAGPGTTIPVHYDALVAKIIAHGTDRADAIARLAAALAETRVDGIATNLPLLARITADPAFCAGGADIHHLERRLAEWRGVCPG